MEYNAELPEAEILLTFCIKEPEGVSKYKSNLSNFKLLLPDSADQLNVGNLSKY